MAECVCVCGELTVAVAVACQHPKREGPHAASGTERCHLELLECHGERLLEPAPKKKALSAQHVRIHRAARHHASARPAHHAAVVRTPAVALRAAARDSTARRWLACRGHAPRAGAASSSSSSSSCVWCSGPVGIHRAVVPERPGQVERRSGSHLLAWHGMTCIGWRKRQESPVTWQQRHNGYLLAQGLCVRDANAVPSSRKRLPPPPSSKERLPTCLP
ncbi:uncharacterized protein SETTUDRAFT_32996 [Exserohilum turcica Et28A]|uniref:Uncharacterized protein n=1 Tax=Exserohilum turcicum (strain 28A) TaxID=671987 RepID=R0IG18_EXST2|nr:uncharacterized protein SETTUDRAFT_32996 [Exserohilum turcica Et28A]EOA83986.1 hypothetical protein SETTUDRAFT_32996 [Exserohilum turcica Et28A]